MFAVAALLLPSTLVAVPIAVTLVLSPTVNAALFAAMLRAAPAEMRGRVTNTVVLGATALAALAPLVAGLLIERFSGRIAMFTFAAVIGIAAIMSMTLTGLRAAEAGSAAVPEQAPAADAGPAQSAARMSPLVGTPVPAVTSTGPSPGTWLTDVPRTCLTPSAMPFMPCR